MNILNLNESKFSNMETNELDSYLNILNSEKIIEIGDRLHSLVNELRLFFNYGTKNLIKAKVEKAYTEKWTAFKDYEAANVVIENTIKLFKWSDIIEISSNDALSTEGIEIIESCIDRHEIFLGHRAMDIGYRFGMSAAQNKNTIHDNLLLRKNFRLSTINDILTVRLPKTTEFRTFHPAVQDAKKILKNPNITEQHLNLYFDLIPMQGIISGNNPPRRYEVYEDFSPLLTANVEATESMIAEWYNKLKETNVDWTLTDLAKCWGKLVSMFLSFRNLEEGIISEIITNSAFDGLDTFRIIEKVALHKNSSQKTKLICYRKTRNKDILPKKIQDYIIF